VLTLNTLTLPTFIALTVATVSSAQATSFYWDGTDTGANSNGGAGTWNTSSITWDDALNGGTSVAWGNTPSDTAIFGGASGTVTLVSSGTPGGTISLGGLTFTSGNYVIGTVAGNGTLDFGSATGSINSSSLASGLTTTINSNLAGSGTPSVTIAANGDLSATGNSSSGKLVLASTNSGLTGGMEITSGLVSFSSAAAAGAGPITLNGGGIVHTTSGTLTLANAVSLSPGTGVLRAYNANTLALSGVVSGSGTLFKTDTGTLILSGANTYTGPTRVGAGTINVSSFNSVNGGTPLLASSSLGAPTTVVNGMIVLGSGTSAGSLTYSGTGETTDRILEIASTNVGPTFTAGGSGLVKITNAVSITGVGSKTITLQGTNTGELAGAIGDSGTAGSTVTTAAFSSGATSVTLASVDGVGVGSTISGTGIAAGTTITAINTGTRVVTISPAASGAGTNGQTMNVSGVVNLTGITKNNSGTWTLSGANTYTGPTNVTGGTLVLSKQASLYQGNPASWTTSNISVNSGCTLGLNVGGSGEFTTSDIAYFDTLGSSTGGLKTGAYLGIDTTNAGGTFTYSGNLTNAGTATSTGLAKLGTGTLVLTGTNTYSGGTRIDGGTLSISSSTVLPSTGTVTVNSAGTLALSGPNTYAPTISGAGKITVATSTTSDTTMLSGTLSGFTGTMEISPATTGGKVQLNTTPAASATIKVLSGGTLFVSASTTYNSAVQLYGGTTGEALGQLRVQNGTWAGAVTLKANSTIGSSNGFNGIISGVIGDEGNGFGFAKLGTSMTTLTGANTYSGPTTILAGAIRANSFNSVVGGTPSSSLGAPTTVANGTISLGDATTTAYLSYSGSGETTDRVINLAGTTGGGTLDHSGTGPLKFTSDLTATGVGAKTLTLQGSGSGEFAGAIVNGSGTTALTKTGSGIWTLSGVNSYTGATNSNGGLLVYANAGAMAGSGRTIGCSTNGGIAFDFNTSLQALLTTRVAAGATGGLALTANNNLAENLDFNAAGFSGYLGAKDNVTYTGTLTPNGSNVRLGNQSGGTLTLTAANVVTGSNNLTINGNVTFTQPQTYTGTTSFTSNAGIFNGGGSVIDLSKVTIGGGGTFTNLDLTGSAALTKSVNTTLTLDSANSYSGGTALSQGLLILSNSGALGSGAVTLATTGSNVARIQLTHGVNIPNVLNLGANNGITGRGGLEVSNVSSAATWSGAIHITANPTYGGHFYTDATSTLTVSGPITSTVPVSFRAGNFIIPAASTSSYSSLFISGNLKIGSANALVTTADVTLANSAITTLDLNGFDQTVNTVVKSTNAATITNTAATPAVLTINNASASTYAGIIANGSGGLSLAKSGAGDLTLGGANTYTGTTTVNAGTLILGASTLADSSTVRISSGAKLTITTTSDTVNQLFLDGVQVAAGTYGATGSGATHIDDAHFSGSGKLVVLSSSAYSAWASVNGLTAENMSASADPDNDGSVNLAEFAFNGSPVSGATGSRLVAGFHSIGAQRVLTLTLPVRNGATFSGTTERVSSIVDGVVYRIQGGGDLSSWNGVVAEVPAENLPTVQDGIAPPESGWTNRSFYLLPGAATTGFLRATVEE
jgi:fibronectin-binding autotransporter adhesin